MSRFTKADIQFHDREPAVNVKVYGPASFDRLAATVEADTGMDGFAEWFAAHDADSFEWAWQAACEDGFEQATELAGEVFGPAYGHYAHQNRRVWQAGRSGGWLYVSDLPDVAEWDAIMLNKWARFAKLCRSIADAVPQVMLDLIAINEYAAECETFDRAESTRDAIYADAESKAVHA